MVIAGGQHHELLGLYCSSQNREKQCVYKGCTLLIYGLAVVFLSVNWQDFSLSPIWTWLSSIDSSKNFSELTSWSIICERFTAGSRYLKMETFCLEMRVMLHTRFAWLDKQNCSSRLLLTLWLDVPHCLLNLGAAMNDPACKLIWETIAEGRVAGRFPEQGSSPWGDVCSEILPLPCFCRWLVSCVFFFLLRVHWRLCWKSPFSHNL